MIRRDVSPAEQLWRAVAGFGEAEFTLRDLHDKLKSRSIDSLRGAMRQLTAASQVREMGQRPGHGSVPPAKVFVCTRPKAPFIPASVAPEAESRQQKMWRAMRRLKDWSVAELAVAAATEEVPVEAPCASAYVSSLVAADVVQVVRPRMSDVGKGSAPARYRLVPSADTGPFAPEVRRGRRVYDVNQRRWLGDAEQVSA